MAVFYSLTTTAVVMVTFVLNVDAVTDQQFQEIFSLVFEQSKVLSEIKLEHIKEIQVYNYRPQGSCEGYVFTPVCHSVQGVVSATVHTGILPLRGRYPPLSRHPPGRWLLQQTALSNEIEKLKTVNIQQDLTINRLLEFIGQNNVLDIEPNQNSTLEERVSLLELQVTDIQQDVSNLDENAVIQDDRLFQLETETEGITEDVEDLQITTSELDGRVATLEENSGDGGNSSVAELEVRVETLEGTATDHETRISATETDINDLEAITSDLETRLTAAEENIQGLQAMDVSLDARVMALEENIGGSAGNDTIAFDAIITGSPNMSEGSTLIFDEILSNEGEGYDSSMGVFTVPPGGDGWYYFFAHFRVFADQYGLFNIQLNGNYLCTMVEDDTGVENRDDGGQGACGTVVYAQEGDEVNVVYMIGSDTFLLWPPTSDYLYHGFVGFHI